MQWKTGRKQKTRPSIKNASISPENRSGNLFPDPYSGGKSLPSFPFSYFGVLLQSLFFFHSILNFSIVEYSFLFFGSHFSFFSNMQFFFQIWEQFQFRIS